MRIAVVIALAALAAGCSHSVDGRADQSGTVSAAPSGATSVNPQSTVATSQKPAAQAPTAPPSADTPIAGVIAWIEAGTPADPADFHTATRDGAATQLGDDVAFVTPSGNTTCMTDSRTANGALACLVDLSDPPPAPETAYGQWKGGWVDFDGTTVLVGSVHGDPGRFGNGDGRELANGSSLKFGDYQCRADPVGLFCVNYAHQSAVRFSDSGIAPYACAAQVTPPEGIGEKFVC